MSRKPTSEFAVRLSCFIATTPQTAFDAFTRPESLSTWFTRNAKTDLRVGGRYSNADKDEGEYIEVDPPSRIRFTWENASHCPGTEVEVRFLENGKGTRVELLHCRIRDLDGHDEMREGWRWALASLKSYLETGTPVPFEDWENSHQKAKGKGA